MLPKAVYFGDRASWRRWLRQNHDKSKEIWVLAFKRHTGKRCVSYEEALEEAICYGWIDSRLRRIDDERHMWRFAPRKDDSVWSVSNKARAEKLIKEGRMTAHGLAKIEAAKANGAWERSYPTRTPARIPQDLKDALAKDEVALANFQRLAKSYRNTYIYWVMSAKREETRTKRIEQVVARSRENLKPGMF